MPVNFPKLGYSEDHIWSIQVTSQVWILKAPHHPDSISLEKTIERLFFISRDKRPKTFVIDFSDTILLDHTIVDRLGKLLTIFKLLGVESGVSNISPALSASLSIVQYPFKGIDIYRNMGEDHMSRCISI